MSTNIVPPGDDTARGRRPGWLRTTLAAVTAAALTVGVIASTTPATADTRPVNSALPDTVSADVLPTPQVNGVVWDQLVVGSTVYVAGDFTSARPFGVKPGESETPRANLLAYDLRSGALLPYAPVFNKAVRSLAVSPDGKRLYAGGYFTTVDGASRQRIAAFDLPTGALSKTFRPMVNQRIQSVVATDTAVYVGGKFTAASVNTSTAGTARSNAAAFAATDGAVLPWAPVASDAVTSMVMSPDRSTVVLGGVFRTLNGSSDPGQTMGAVDAVTGTTMKPWKINTAVPSRPLPATGDYAVYSLASDGEYVYGTMGPGAFEGTFKARWSDGEIGWLADCMGDSYSVYPAGDVVYSASHAHNCSNIGDFPETRTTSEATTPRTYKRVLAFTEAATSTVKKKVSAPGNTSFTAYAGKPAPTVLNWYPEFDTGPTTLQGPWDVTGAEGFVLVGGEFGTVNGAGQQGLARFAPSTADDAVGPALSGAAMTPTVTARGGRGVAVSVTSNFDYDNQQLRYDLERDGKVIATQTDTHRFWERATLTFGDDDLTVGQTYSYRVRTTDPLGNSTLGNTVTYTATDGAMTGLSTYDRKVEADGPALYWPFNEKEGSTTAFDRVGANDLATTPGTRPAGMEAKTPGASTVYPGGSTWSAATMQTGALSTHSQELWFKTTSKTGGELMGFASTRAQSGTVGRQLYMNSAGLVQYTPADSAKSLASASNVAYNDGRWHHVVATTGPSGSALYIDGKLVRTLATATSTQTFAGYWHVGGYSLSGRPGSRTSDFYTGSLDNVAVYPRVLDAATIAAHYTAAAGGQPAALAADTFSRGDAAGWGTAETGGPWTLAGGASGFSVADGRGVISVAPGATRSAKVGVASTATESTVSFRLAERATAAQYVSLIGRDVGSAAYSARVVVQPDGKLQLQLLQSSTALGKTVTVGTYAPGDSVTIRLRVVGAGTTSLAAKAWTTGAEPDWQLSATDTTAALQVAGATGVKLYTAASGATTTASFDDYRVMSVG